MAERSAPIHAGPDVDRLAAGMGARAFSFDGHVFLGRSAQTSADAPRILRHELDHAEHGVPQTLYADQQAGALDSAAAFPGSTLESMVPVVADYLPAEISGALKTALALEKLRGQISSLSTTFVTQAKASLAGLPTAVQGSLREHGAPTWFTDTTFPFLVEAGSVVLEMAGSMLWEVFRDIVAPHWGVFTQDLPALWKGVQRIWAGIRALDYREILAGQSDVEQSLLSGAGRFELALGVWLFLIGALAGGGVGATVGGGGSAAVSAGAAAPAGAGAGGGVGGGVGGATTAAVAEALGLALVAGQFAADAKAIATSLLSWATSDEPEKQTQYLNEALTAAFRAGSIIVMMGLAFAAVKVSRFVARIVRPLLERPATRELIERASLRMRSFLKGAPEAPKPARLPGTVELTPHPSASVVEGARAPNAEPTIGHAPTPEPARAVEPEPVKVPDAEPARSAESGSAKVGEPEPMKAGEPEPVNVAEPEPVKVTSREPANAPEPRAAPERVEPASPHVPEVEAAGGTVPGPAKGSTGAEEALEPPSMNAAESVSQSAPKPKAAKGGAKAAKPSSAPAKTRGAKKPPRKSEWRRRLEADGRPMPTGMKRPHGHHVVMKGDFRKWKPEARRAVQESQKILADLDIDFRTDAANLTWAENAGHSQAYATKVRDRLRATVDEAVAAEYTRDEVREAVIRELREMGRLITTGDF